MNIRFTQLSLLAGELLLAKGPGWLPVG